MRRLNLIVLLLVALPLSASAEDYDGPMVDNYVTIVRHASKPGTKFPLPGGDFVYAVPAKTFRVYDPAKQGPDTSTDSRIQLKTLPPCRESRVRRQEVGGSSPMTVALDAVFFDASNEGDARRSQSLTTQIVPYENGGVLDLAATGPAKWQTFADSLGIFCLPTRFHFVHDSGRNYMEFREGEEAWVE